MRTFEDALLDAVRRVRESGTEYAISGGVAKALYGAPSFTKDLDVLASDPKPIEYSFRPDFRLVATDFSTDVYEDVSGFVIEVFAARSDLEREMLGRARAFSLGRESVRVLDQTDWAAMKIREAKHSPVEAQRHLADVRKIHELAPLDCERLVKVSRELGTEALLRSLGICPSV